jgi:hypothetical protein
MKKTSMTLINEKLKGFFDLENFDPSLLSLKKTKPSKVIRLKTRKEKPKKLNGKQVKTTKTQNSFS